MEGSRKAFETPYGSSVISEEPLAGPPVTNGKTLPGTQQLCGPCASGGYCPIHNEHSPRSAGAWGVVHTPAKTASPTETLGSIVGSFLDKIVDHVSKRVTAEVLTELRVEMEARDAEELAEELEARADAATVGARPAEPYDAEAIIELALTLLADALDEEGFTTLLAIDERQIAKMVVVDDPRVDGKVITIKVADGWPTDEESALFRVDYQDLTLNNLVDELREVQVIELFKWLRTQKGTATA